MISLEELCLLMQQYNLPITVDSRKAEQGGIFVLLNPANADVYLPDALNRGARYTVTSPGVSVPDGLTAVMVENPRIAAARLSALKYDTASLPFPLIGITGTNGKTTTAYLLEHLFKSMGMSAGVIGTVAVRWNGHEEYSAMTTPDAPDLHRILASMRTAGIQAAAMEVSSHALDQERAAYIPFGGAVFTNLTQDHLDYHKTFDAYFEAKARLFFDTLDGNAAMSIGTDGEWGQKLAERVFKTFGFCPKLVTFGLKSFEMPSRSGARHLHGRILSSDTKGLHLSVTLTDAQGSVRSWEIQTPLVGAFNAENLLAVQAVALGLGINPDAFSCFSDFRGVTGRLERIENNNKLDIFVDFAHTPDALTNSLQALRGAGFKRIICVFGCGGDRDRGKRPLMGGAVARCADVAVVTSDNPRSEDPAAIINEILPGLQNAHQVIVEPDRRAAIAHALKIMNPGDALIVAGKGHERTQQIGGIKYPFSDQQTIMELCQCR